MTSLATVTGRIGAAVDHALLYVKAGGAFARFNHSVQLGAAVFAPGVTPFASGAFSDSRSGVVFGAGVEYAFWGNWSAKLEYDYVDFGTSNVDFPIAGSAIAAPGVTVHTFSDQGERVQLVRAGLNWRFNW